VSAPTPASAPLGYHRLFLAVFLLFAPLPGLLMVAPQRPHGPAYVLLNALIGGLISVGWCAAFVLDRRRWLWFVAPASALMPTVGTFLMHRAGLGQGVPDASATAWRTTAVFLAIFCVVAGYVLLVGFIRHSERAAERARAELDLAADLHRSLVPPVHLRTPLAEVFGRSDASSEMGGDLIDVLPRDAVPGESPTLDVLLGDVSGHGVGAGVVMAMLKASLRTSLLQRSDLSAVVADANRVLADCTAPNMFATFAALRLAPGQPARMAIAGHLPILHRRAADGSWHRHPAESLPLGIEPDEVFASVEVPVAPGDLLVLYTDGLTEVQDPSGRELSLDAFARVVDEAATTVATLPEIHTRIVGAVRAFGRQLDDQSLVLVRVC